MPFQRAERKRAYLKLALTGPSGSGKTYSALKLAFGLGKRIAVLDTENESASLYADLGTYDVCTVGAPFTVAKYQAAISDAIQAGYDVLILDSLSHAWAGEGGLLTQKEALDTRGGNSYTNWATITKQHEAFKASILQAPVHIIATMRSKVEYAINQTNGKSVPQKLGMAPIQRDGLEYEFTTVFDLAADHSAVTSKDRTGLFDGLNAMLTEQHGKRLATWLAGGAEPQAAPVTEPAQNGRAKAAQAMSAAESGSYSEATGAAPAAGVSPQAAMPNGEEPPACCTPDCGKPLTKGQAQMSVHAFGKPLCPACQKDEARTAAVAAA